MDDELLQQHSMICIKVSSLLTIVSQFRKLNREKTEFDETKKNTR